MKLNAKYSTYFLPPGATKGLKRNRNNRSEVIKKTVSFKIQVNPLIYDGVYFKQSYTYQLINYFTKNDHYPRSASRFLPFFKSTNWNFKNFQNILGRLPLSWKLLTIFTKKILSEMFGWVLNIPLIFRLFRGKLSRSLLHVKINS